MVSASQGRGYKNIFDAALSSESTCFRMSRLGSALVQVGKIARSEGVLSMWRTGVVPNMNRATGREPSMLNSWHLHVSLCLDVDLRQR